MSPPPAAPETPPAYGAPPEGQPYAQQQTPPAYGQQPPPAYGQPPPGQYPPGQYPPGYPAPYAQPQEATGAYWLGILSIIFAFLFSYLGLILGIIAIYLGKQGQQQGLLKADRAVTFGIIGVVLSIIFIVISIIIIGAIFAFAG
jgi:hypothetical protein